MSSPHHADLVLLEALSTTPVVRFASFFLCPRHRSLLPHRCPGCGMPARFARSANAVARLSGDTLHPWQCRFVTRPTSRRQGGAACGADLTRMDSVPEEPDAATMTVLLQVQRQVMDLLAAGGPKSATSAGSPVPVAHYFADVRAIVAMTFRSWPIAREYAGTACPAAVLDAEYASRAAQAQPLLNTPGKKKTSKPYTAPLMESLAAGTALDIALQLLGAPDAHDAQACLDPLVQQLRGVDLALSTYLRRPAMDLSPSADRCQGPVHGEPVFQLLGEPCRARS